jgi:hypothetical protein
VVVVCGPNKGHKGSTLVVACGAGRMDRWLKVGVWVVDVTWFNYLHDS